MEYGFRRGSTLGNAYSERFHIPKLHSFIKTRHLWHSKGFTLKVGTIFEDSPLGLDKWMCAYWMLCNCKNGVSSCQIARTLGITRKFGLVHDASHSSHDEG